ncbi:tyrosine-type recombinase/integrase [Alteromonas sp. A081]|uniref:tyrosine-type recombinase/integrase n=1 Tax=Alteromonas sp. A081 TaxID=3410269 RepID=UPI003B97D757
MLPNSQPTINGLLPNGELDFAWLAQNCDALLDKEVLKLLINFHQGVNLSIHGKLIRFAKRVNGKPLRINLGNATFAGVAFSAKKSQELITVSDCELVAEKSKSERRNSVKIRIEDVCIEYLSKEVVGLKPATIKGYKTLLNRLVKNFNHIPLERLSHCDVEKWLTSNLDNTALSWKTIKETLWMLEQIISRAKLMNITLVNQGAVDFKKLKKYLSRFEQQEKTVDDTKTLSVNDLQTLEALSHEELLQHNLHIIRDSALLTAKSVATRSGEARAIALEDVLRDENGDYKINVVRSLVLEQFKQPKAYNKCLSVVDVFGVAKLYLERLIDDAQGYNSRQLEVLNHNNEVELQNVTPLVINPATGNPYTEKEYRNEFYRLQEYAGIEEPIPPKQLRHTAVKTFHDAGVAVEDFCKQLTHANHSTTIKFYAGAVQLSNSPEKTKMINIKLDNLWSTENKPLEKNRLKEKEKCRQPTVPMRINLDNMQKLKAWESIHPFVIERQPKLIHLPNSP